MSTGRRDFLHNLTLSGVALGALPSTLRAAEPDDVPVMLDDWRAQAQQPAATTFDSSWTQKLTGKYRAVFDSPEINGGAGVWRAGMWVDHYKQVLKADRADLNPVIVIRHAAIPLIMNNEFWERYDINKKRKVGHPFDDKKKTRHNPVLMTVEDDQIPASFVHYTLHKQIESGAIVLACNLAFGGMVGTIAKEEKLKFPEAREKALTMMVPGVILQPNGIFGVTLAQQNGCAFVQAT